MNAPKPIIAAFDFDGTLTHSESLFNYLRYYYGLPTVLKKGWPLLGVWLAYKLKIIRNDKAKQWVLVNFFKGQPLSSLQQRGKQFAASVIPLLLRPAAIQRLAWHQQQGHRCILVSASLDIYLAPWGQQTGFSEVLCSSLAVNAEGITSGLLSGPNCFGEQKVKRLAALLGDRDQYILYAYGDTRGDRELLAYADYGFYRQFPVSAL